MNTTKKQVGRPKKTGNSVSKQMNVGMPGYLLEQIEEQGKTKHNSFSGYVRTLIENDLKQVPSV